MTSDVASGVALAFKLDRESWGKLFDEVTPMRAKKLGCRCSFNAEFDLYILRLFHALAAEATA
ncbi:hypothetical protein [Pseudofrankia sp. DC12]|uniref:hypothetical protein n=1 Tax=Pseudofrankia sp. DC12 TaxID=683315 RepID=UPI000A573346|nr:hypothetical protein [Pseudofrankia sp. DC12]